MGSCWVLFRSTRVLNSDSEPSSAAPFSWPGMEVGAVGKVHLML